VLEGLDGGMSVYLSKVYTNCCVPNTTVQMLANQDPYVSYL